MSRRIAREIVLQSLFQIDFSECEAGFALEASCAEHPEEDVLAAKEYAAALLTGVVENKEAVDSKIGEYAIDWTVERMPATDRNILRIAVYEMFFAEPVLAPGVAINEAVEIAKMYGTEESGRFINGILGKMVK